MNRHIERYPLYDPYHIVHQSANLGLHLIAHDVCFVLTVIMRARGGPSEKSVEKQITCTVFNSESNIEPNFLTALDQATCHANLRSCCPPCPSRKRGLTEFFSNLNISIRCVPSHALFQLHRPGSCDLLPLILQDTSQHSEICRN